MLEKCRQPLRKPVRHGGHRFCRSTLRWRHLWSSSEITFDSVWVFVFWDSWPLWALPAFHQSAGAVLLYAERNQSAQRIRHGDGSTRNRSQVGLHENICSGGFFTVFVALMLLLLPVAGLADYEADNLLRPIRMSLSDVKTIRLHYGCNSGASPVSQVVSETGSF